MTSPKNLFRAGGTALALVLSVPLTLHGQETAIESEHARQMQQLEAEGPPPPSADAAEREQLLKDGKLLPLKSAGKLGPKAATPKVSDDFIVFGYTQSTTSQTYTDFYRWESLTHVASPFVSFAADGTVSVANENVWLNRDVQLQTGGAAEAAGVKVILTMLNSGFDVSVINSVMTSPTARATLISEIHNLVATGGYCGGVTFDFEPFSWNSSARDGMTTFFQDLRTDLDTIDPNLEISLYSDPIPSTTRFDFAGFTPSLDYYLFSSYDYAVGSTAHAISDFNNYITGVNTYLDNGVPASKMVVVISTYSGRWDGVTAYNGSGGPRVPGGFTDGLYETTEWQSFGGPQTENYVTGDEVSWHTWNDTGTDYTRTWDSPTAIEYKFRHALSNQDSGTTQNGRRLRGVGFWSLIWLAETNSYDPITTSSSGKTRMYPHVFQLAQEILHAPGDTKYLATGFECLDFRWRQPIEGSDDVGDTDNNSTRSIVAAPAGSGRPASTTNAMQVNFDFESAGANKLFFRFEPLADNRDTARLDRNSAPALFDANSAVSAYIYTPASYTNSTVRIVVRDSQKELEMSDPFTLNASGWREVTFDLTDATQVNPYNTSELLLVDGDGVIDTAGGGAKDVALQGFLIEATGAKVGSLVFDEVSYQHVNPGGLNYKINEFRYNNASAEFVEIHGPAGNFPAGTELRFYDSSDGTVLSSVSLAGQTIPVDGHFVVGDTGVTNVDHVPGGWGVADNIPNTNSGSIQIYNTSTGCVYDSVVFRAYAGLGDLIRKETHGVTGESYAWLGETGSGTSDHVFARYPDGADTNVNQDDFSLMAATPGTANGGAFALPSTFNFNSTPAGAIATYQTFLTVASGVGASPSGGNVHRCIDTTGGGAQTYIGDPSLNGTDGYSVTGEIFIPNGAAPIQSIGIGICGRQGSNFFTNTPNSTSSSGYESGYWLIFENAAGAGLNDGRADHADTFEFVHATNDNMDDTKVSLLGSATRASTGASAGAWTTFELAVDPVGGNLTAKINGSTIYFGPIPAGGPTTGAFQIGFRENHVGGPAATEGTWIDNVSITGLNRNDPALMNLD